LVFPHRNVMLALSAMSRGLEFSIFEDTLTMGVRTQDGWYPVTGEELDELVKLRWVIYPSDDEVAVTSLGRKQLRKWREKQLMKETTGRVVA
jgi:hypothetical protein